MEYYRSIVLFIMGFYSFVWKRRNAMGSVIAQVGVVSSDDLSSEVEELIAVEGAKETLEKWQSMIEIMERKVANSDPDSSILPFLRSEVRRYKREAKLIAQRIC